MNSFPNRDDALKHALEQAKQWNVYMAIWIDPDNRERWNTGVYSTSIEHLNGSFRLVCPLGFVWKLS